MLTACERRLLAFYLANAASRLHYRDYEASNLADWVADRANGVTELCKALAGRLGVTLYGVGESTGNGEEPSRHQRLQELRLSQRLLARERRSLVLFDEMEDLLSEPFAGLAFFGRPPGARLHDGGSKVFMHRLLEQAPSPTLWTMNDARRLSPPSCAA